MDKKILGMGNAVLDILAPVTEDFIKSKNLDKGSMTLVDQQISDKMLDQIEPVKKDSGGSVANTIVAISLLGLKSFFCGKVKSDNLGDDFISDMQATNTNFLCDQSEDGLPTARCIIFVTPDGERSMQTFLGASTTLDEKDVKEEYFRGISYLLIEGYLWSSATARQAIMKALKISSQMNIKIVFSLSDSNLVKMFKKDFLSFTKSYVDILIGNENECNELFNMTNRESIIKENNLEIMVMTKGEKGAEIFTSQSHQAVEAQKVNSVIDTTGAGDMFAAGFLFKLLKGENPSAAAEFGCRFASQIIQQYGARPTEEILEKIRETNN
ncbi:MAG: adenosine kinase [Alphaproteobacteria bacterium]